MLAGTARMPNELVKEVGESTGAGCEACGARTSACTASHLNPMQSYMCWKEEAAPASAPASSGRSLLKASRSAPLLVMPTFPTCSVSMPAEGSRTSVGNCTTGAANCTSTSSWGRSFSMSHTSLWLGAESAMRRPTNWSRRAPEAGKANIVAKADSEAGATTAWSGRSRPCK